MGKYHALDTTTLGLGPEAVKFLAAMDEWIFGKQSTMPICDGDEVTKQIIVGLAFRIITESGHRKADEWIANYTAGQRLKNGKLVDGQIHDHDTKSKALALYDRLVGQGKLVKTAESQVQRKYNVSRRTLLNWRKNREKLPASL